MERKTFPGKVASVIFDISKNYRNLYNLFYDDTEFIYGRLSENVNEYFKYFPNNIRKNCITIEEFDRECGFDFPENNNDKDVFITFCEYLTNILKWQKIILERIITGKKRQSLRRDKEEYFCNNIKLINTQIEYAIEQMCYMSIIDENNIISFVPKSPEAIAVSESAIIPNNLTSYEILKYYHHSLKGNIQEKKQILLKLAHVLEPKIQGLAIYKDLSCLLNNLNIRHNNITKNDKNYKQYVAQMADKDLEEWYDITYRMCLLAVLELEYQDAYKTKIDTLKRQL